jgi:hypothetical protein
MSGDGRPRFLGIQLMKQSYDSDDEDRFAQDAVNTIAKSLPA